MSYRGSIIKWVLFAFALLLGLVTMADKTAAYGSLDGGLWVAFAVLHAGDRMAQSETARSTPPAPAQT